MQINAIAKLLQLGIFLEYTHKSVPVAMNSNVYFR